MFIFIVNKKASATFLWDPIYVRDNQIKSVRCRNANTKYSKQFNIVVIPSESFIVYVVIPSIIHCLCFLS